MRFFVLILLALLFGWSLDASAEMIVLKNGSKINGKILKEDTDKIEFEVSGVPLTYYRDQIARIEGAQPKKVEAIVSKPSDQAKAVDVEKTSAVAPEAVKITAQQPQVQ